MHNDSYYAHNQIRILLAVRIIYHCIYIIIFGLCLGYCEVDSISDEVFHAQV